MPKKNMSFRPHQAVTHLVILILFALVSLPAQAAGVARDDEKAEVVGMFDAIEKGDIEVRFIPQDIARGNLLVTNKTKKMLHVHLPEAFAAINVQPQFGGMGGMGGGMGGMGGGMGGMGGGMGGMGGGMGQGMGMGGGMGGMGGGMGGMGGGMMGGGMGGMMRVAPEKMQKRVLTTICLEHGKPDPTPKMAYRVVPIETLTKDPSVVALCKHVGYGRVTQNAAQAAAWHLTAHLSWQQLAQKNRIESKYTGNVPYFTPLSLQTAMTLVHYINTNPEKSSSDDSSSSSDSSSQSPGDGTSVSASAPVSASASVYAQPAAN